MNMILQRSALALGAFVLALTWVPGSQAQCGGIPAKLLHSSGWHPQYGQARLLRASLGGMDDGDEDNPTIVGFWHFKFVSDGVTTGIPGGIPAGAEVDAGYAQWHSDGTEITNSGGRAPDTSAFCLGVWSKVGPRRYKLNHFAASWDPTKGATGLIGPAHIKENVKLASDGQSFAGTFSVDQYDETGNLLVHLQGSVTGTRINVNTAPSSIF